jgi:hypothetical protein
MSASAAAVVAAFRREADDFIHDDSLTLPTPDYCEWAFRLASEVESLLQQVGELAAITPRQREVLGQVLADAIAYRDPSGICPECDRHPAGLCEGHAEDLDKTDAYFELGRQLGIEADHD